MTVDGALLPSPTREKLEPVIPRQKEEDLPKSPQKASPKSSPRSGNLEQLCNAEYISLSCKGNVVHAFGSVEACIAVELGNSQLSAVLLLCVCF